MFVLSERLFKYLPDEEVFDLSFLINMAIKANEKVGLYKHDGFWADMGKDIKTYFELNMDLLVSHENLLEKLGFYSICKKLGLSFSQNTIQASLYPDVTFTPPFLIVGTPKIEPNSSIGPYCIVGDRCHIGAQAHISQSILLSGATVETSTLKPSIHWADHVLTIQSD